MTKLSKPSLAQTHPELAAQADGWDPTTVTYGSHAKVDWKCEFGHTWNAIVKNRSNGSGCPVCSGYMPRTGLSDLATANPELAAQADGWDPTTVTAGSRKKVHWKCESGHTWNAAVADRHRGSGCPVCSGRNALEGFNDLATINPELAAQADGWDPTTVTASSDKKVDWKCKFGHTWRAVIASRSQGRGCPVCVGKTALKGFNDLATVNPELAAQADGWDPTTLTAGSGKKVDWKCELGHTWIARVAKRSSGQGCPACSGHKVLVGFNDLATTNPELAAQADGWDATTVSRGAMDRVDWKCELGHTWNTAVTNRITGSGCPICSNKQVLVGYNDLATTNPELAAQADGWDPRTLTAWSNKQVGWRCHFGHIWNASVGSRSAKQGCPVCSGNKVLGGFNDLATTNPELAAQADGWDATTVSRGSNRKVKWRCEFDHTWIAPVASRSSGQGCPSCAPTGYDPNRDGWLYLLDHDEWGLSKVGISNVPAQRLNLHMQRGWAIVEVRGPMDGFLTHQLETNCLKALEKRGAILGHKAGVAKFDGYSEAWTNASLKVTSIKQILDWVYEDEESTLKSGTE
jgi:hypothetical protein